ATRSSTDIAARDRPCADRLTTSGGSAAAETTASAHGSPAPHEGPAIFVCPGALFLARRAPAQDVRNARRRGLRASAGSGGEDAPSQASPRWVIRLVPTVSASNVARS